MPGPLPAATRRRTNPPTIPTTVLPAGGFTGPIPKLPPGVKLGRVGKAWWTWAWRTPQAAGWSPGHEVTVARRASLEDDLAALDKVEGLNIGELRGAEDAREFKWLISRIAAMATGRLSLMKEMRELDDRLGFTPKGQAALRWTIKSDATPATGGKTSADGVVVTPDRWRRTVD